MRTMDCEFSRKVDGDVFLKLMVQSSYMAVHAFFAGWFSSAFAHLCQYLIAKANLMLTNSPPTAFTKYLGVHFKHIMLDSRHSIAAACIQSLHRVKMGKDEVW